MKKTIAGIVLLFILSINVHAQKTILQGNVSDKKTGETIVGASVFLVGTTTGAMTDFDGNFTIKNIDPGKYTLKCSFISYEPQSEIIVLQLGEEQTINFKLSEATIEVDEVTVVARANRENETLLLMDQKESEGIKESIGAQRLSILGVSDAAAATSKISGVTKNEESGDIYIRGLGDRYLSTTMNGLPIPSDNIEKKNIDLNLFSTDVIQNIGISKTYSSASYGDQSSGQVDIVSKTFTDKIEMEVSAGTGTNILQNNVFGNYKTTQNMNHTTVGFFRSPLNLENTVKNESWNTLNYSLPLNKGFSILGGKRFNPPNNDELTVFATLSHNNDFKYNNGIYKKYRGYVLDRSFTDAETFKTSVNTTGLLNINYKLNNENNINLNTLFVNKTTDELYEQGRNGEGYYYDQIPQDSATFMRDQNIKQTSILVNQLLGTHKLNDRNTLKWAVGANLVKANEPNRIQNKVIMLEEDKIFFVRRTYFEQSKLYQKINDFETNGYVNNQILFANEEQKKFEIDYGTNLRVKTRNFNSLKRALTTRETAVSIDDLDAILINKNLYDLNLIDYQDQSKEDTYEAILGVVAGYINSAFKRNNFSGNIGLRYEFDMLDVEWDVTNYLGRNGNLNNAYHNFLPSLNIKYNFSLKNALRFSASKTITLPEFKELAPFEYVSPTGQVTKGNPELQKSVNYNVDLKWELFPTNKELISVSSFYKRINNPINLAQTRGSSGNFYYANTGNNANVYGIEIETRWKIIKAKQKNKNDLNLSLNATKMWFNQDLLEIFQYNNKTETNLQGAAGFIFNGALLYSNNRQEFTATITGNYSSDKILVLGAPESQANSDKYFNNEIIEKGFTTLNMVVSKKITNRITLKLTGKNLINPNIEQTQEIKIPSQPESTVKIRSYKKGISLKLGVKINLK